MISKIHSKLSNNQSDHRAQEPTQRYYQSVQNKTILLQDDGSATQRVSQCLNKNQQTQWNINIQKVFNDLFLDQLYELFIDFQNRTRKINKNIQKEQNQQLLSQIIKQFHQQCVSFKINLENKIMQSQPSHFQSKNSSTQKQKNMQMTQLLGQIYFLRQKVRKYEKQDRKNSFFASSIQEKSRQISNPFGSPQFDNENQNINPNIIHNKDKNSCLLVKNEQYSKKLQQKNDKRVIQVHRSYLQLKAGFLSLCGCLWKTISQLIPESSSQVFQLLNSLRKNQLKRSNSAKNIDLTILYKTMQKSNNDMLTFSNFIEFIVNHKIQKNSEKQAI